MGKMGRPPLDEPMVHKVSVRFNEKDYQRLKTYAEAFHKTMTEAVKDGIELLFDQESAQDTVVCSEEDAHGGSDGNMQ